MSDDAFQVLINLIYHEADIDMCLLSILRSVKRNMGRISRFPLLPLKKLCKASHKMYQDAKNYTGLMDCQARAPWKLNFAFNASFASLNIAKLMMKERGMDYSMSNFKALMAGTFLMKRIFDVSRYRPN